MLSFEKIFSAEHSERRILRLTAGVGRDAACLLYTSTGFISSAELTEEANDKYLEYAKELEITVERRIVWDDPYFKEQAPAKEFKPWWDGPTITPVEPLED